MRTFWIVLVPGLVGSLSGCGAIGEGFSVRDEEPAVDAGPGAADAGSPELDPDAGPVDAGGTTVEVAGSAAWVDTGLDLEVGEHARIDASGTVSYVAGQSVDPHGDPRPELDPQSILHCVNHASLIGRIGDSGEPFLIGSSAEIAATEPGRLHLAVNDAGAGDNTGGFTATVWTDLAHQVVDSAPASVAGATAWTDTGVDLGAGDQLTVSATGTIFASATVSCGPAGVPDRPELHQYNVLACPDHASLIGRIGPTGAPFPVDRSLSVPAPDAGRLYLGINDRGLTNNSGAFATSVTVSRVTRSASATGR